MKLSAVQYCPPHGDVVAARVDLCNLVRKAQGADLIVCPEMAVSGYVFSSPEEIRPFAEPSSGPTFSMLRECAIDLRATIICGIAEVDRGKLYNSAITVSPNGDLMHCYRKVLLYEQDETWARAGRERKVLKIPNLGNVCPAICMDLNDDDFVMYIHEEEPDVIAFCTNWIEQGADMLPYWRWRLCGWQGYFVVANRWGEERGTSFYGRSTVLGPDDLVLGALPPKGDAVLCVNTETQTHEIR